MRKLNTIVAGCGNSLLGDDGAGIAVVRRLAGLELPPGVGVVDVGSAVHDLVHILAGAGRAIIVDAVLAGRRSGTLAKYTLNDIRSLATAPWTMHDLGVAEAVQLLAALRPDSVPEILWYGIEIGRLPVPGTNLSPPVRRAVCRVVDEIYGLLHDLQ